MRYLFRRIFRRRPLELLVIAKFLFALMD